MIAVGAVGDSTSERALGTYRMDSSSTASPGVLRWSSQKLRCTFSGTASSSGHGACTLHMSVLLRPPSSLNHSDAG